MIIIEQLQNIPMYASSREESPSKNILGMPIRKTWYHNKIGKCEGDARIANDWISDQYSKFSWITEGF